LFWQALRDSFEIRSVGNVLEQNLSDPARDAAAPAEFQEKAVADLQYRRTRRAVAQSRRLSNHAVSRTICVEGCSMSTGQLTNSCVSRVSATGLVTAILVGVKDGPITSRIREIWIPIRSSVTNW